LIAMLALSPASLPAESHQLTSPDGRIAVTFSLTDQGRLSYSVSHAGRPVLADSLLTLLLEDRPGFDRGFHVENTSLAARDITWKPVYGERSEIRDHYNELTVDLGDEQDPPRSLQLVFRAYDEGAALCYRIPRQPGLEEMVISSEETEFCFTGNHACWPVYSAQGVYEKSNLDAVEKNCERPLLVQIPDGPCVAVGEARLVDYARMRLQPIAGRPHTLGSMLAGEVRAKTPFATPWRVVMIADTPGELLQRNYLLLNLNDPCAIADTSWIKPGKVIREVTLTTEGGKACVDFAVGRGLQYVEYDAGWYGHEYEEASDATTVTRDTEKSSVRGDLDLHEVIRYAAERGIGILVYVNRRQLERQLDEILPLYEEWGIKGVKYGFVQVGSQQWTAWLHEAVRKAADHHLMVDVHDEYRPTGYERTYPNLMTQEGIRGNECMPPAEHNLILPFTRMLCGAGDYTVCWYSGRIQTTHAHQLACAVVFYSPFQFLFWYDRPAMYQGEPELDFFKHVPTVWDETRIVHGEVGRYATIARRCRRAWYVGTLNAAERRTLDIPLAFLKADTKYTAEIHSDGSPRGENPSSVAIRRLAVDSTTILHADMAPNGGQAIRIVPVDQQDK
jgi:alpha-glucosidase